ncbi:unnamed protein product [Ambrosiozyma monospora]|uniref:Unnamed protein product n=1 Tax=Ambrosiozyma monospora TaxID=43982 RepID=A0ACB5STA6_AMBMO|nr:unnamed protein product [Ambrosiozyma monospora]
MSQTDDPGILNLVTRSKLESLQHILRQLSLDLIIEIFAIVISQLHIQQWERLYSVPEFQQIFRKVLSGITVRFLGDHVFEFGLFDCDLDEIDGSMKSLLDFMEKKDLKFERFVRCDFSTPLLSILSLVRSESPEQGKRKELLNRMASHSKELVIGFKELTEISSSHYERLVELKTDPQSHNESMFSNAPVLRCLNGGSFPKLANFTFLVVHSVSADDLSILDWFVNKLQNGVSGKNLQIIFIYLTAETHFQEFQKTLLHSCVPDISGNRETDGKVVLSVEVFLEDISSCYYAISKYITKLWFSPTLPIIDQILLASCPNLKESGFLCNISDPRVVELAAKFPVFKIASDTITHYMNEFYASGMQCELSGLTRLKFLTLRSMLRGSVIGRCVPDSVECMEINSCFFLDLCDFSYAYLFKLPKALKRLKVVDSEVCFKNLRSLKYLQEVMLEFGEDERGAVLLSTSDGEGEMSNKSSTQPQDWSTLRIVSTIVSQLPKSVISLKINYPNELFYNNYFDLRYLKQLVELNINGPWISHYKIFDRLPLELLKLVILYHTIESTEDLSFESTEDEHIDGLKSQMEFTLELEFHPFKAAEDFWSSRVAIEEKVKEEFGYDCAVKLSSSLVCCLSNYMIDSNFKCQWGIIAP